MLLGIEISQGERFKVISLVSRVKSQVILILMGVIVAANFSLFSAEE